MPEDSNRGGENSMFRAIPFNCEGGWLCQEHKGRRA